MSMPTVRNTILGTLALAAVLLGFRYGGDRHPAAGTKADAAAPVSVALVERHDMPVLVHAPGTILANALVNVSPRVQGALESAEFREGEFVNKGQLLFRIDPRPFQANLAQANALLLRDEAQLENARLDRKRYDALYREHMISAQARDAATTNTTVLSATVAADKAAVDLARVNLGYTQIRAPIDGKTGAIVIQPGNMVAAAGTTVLVTIAQIRPVKLSFDLPQSDLPLIQKRMRSGKILASLDATGRHLPLAAPVDFIGNVISGQSDTIELRATFPNTDLSLVPGQAVNVTAELDDIPHALIVPHDAVNDGPGGSYVYLVQGGHAVQRPVQVLFDDARHAAVRGNLTPGDSVIVEGQLRIVPGGAVKIFPPFGSPAAAR